MFASKRGLFSSENGTTKSWLAGITSAALLIGTVALPAVANDEATPEQQAIVEPAEVTTEEVSTTAEETNEGLEAVIDEPMEEVVEEPADAVIDQPGEEVAEDSTEVGAQAADEPSAQPEARVASEESLTGEPDTSASSTDGETADNNSPPAKKSASKEAPQALAVEAAAIGEEFITGNQVNTTLEGCRASTASYTKVVNGQIVTYICNDSEYTPGNLGKGWNELDLVPHRLTTSLGNQSGATETYDLILAGDNSLGGYEGYDIVTYPVVNKAKSDAQCTIEALPQAERAGITGGVEDGVYRIVRIYQPKGSTCVFDFNLRLSNTAADFSGSSLQAYMFGGPDFTTGKKTVPIPVGEVLPQVISKTATAVQGQSYDWSIKKTTTPSRDWSDTCMMGDLAQTVSVKVEWTRIGPNADGTISYEAKIYATNPSKRGILVTVTDRVYGVTGTTKTFIDVKSFPQALVPAGETILIGEWPLTIQGTYDAIYDKATGSYFDPDLNLPISPDNFGENTAPVTAGTIVNDSVVVTDVEEITAGFTFKVTAATDLSGFAGGTLPPLANPGDKVTWTKTVSSSGLVEFTKAVTPKTGYTGAGTLSDIATINSLAGELLDKAEKSTALSAAKLVDLTVVKYTPKVFTGTQSATFTFQVLDSDGKVVATKDMKVDANSPVDVENGQYRTTITFDNLVPAKYTVRELPAIGWAPQPDQEADLTAKDVVCTSSVTFQNEDIRDLTVSKTATPSFDRTYTWEVAKSVDKDYYEFADGDGPATPKYTIKVTRTAKDSNFKVTGTITVENPNTVPVPLTSVTDTLPGATCSVTDGPTAQDPDLVPASKSLTYKYSCTFPGAATTGTNTANIAWETPWTYEEKTYTTPNSSASGTAGYDFSKVIPTEYNTSVWLDDPNAPASAGFPVQVTDPGTYTYDASYPGEPGTCTTYPNTATIYADVYLYEEVDSDSASVEVCVGEDLTVSKTAAGTYGRTYLWDISKDVNETTVSIADGGSYTFTYTVVAEQTGIADDAWTLAGKITVSNPNDWQAITADVTDLVDNGGLCTVTGGTGVKVAAGTTVELSYSCTFSSKPSSYTGINTATADWSMDTAAVTPKTSASGTAGFTMTQSGGTNKEINVTDTYAGDLGTVMAKDSAPYAKATFTYDRKVSGVAGTCTMYDNTATIVETGQSDEADVKVCVGVDLTVSKTAAGTFDRSYLWSIDKSVEDSRIEIAQGGAAMFDYAVTVTPEGYTDSGWTMSGTIKVTNPNDWQDITADVTDVFDGGGTCTVEGGDDVTIAAGKSVTLEYACTFSAKPEYTGTNTATATWDEKKSFTPNGSASGTAEVTLTLKGETNRTIDVVDDKTDPANPVELGTVDYYDGILIGGEGAEPADFTFGYSLTKEGVAGECTDYTNTAIIEQTDQSDSVVVTVCVGQDLTITKSAAGSYNRLYNWTIDKSVDQTSVLVDMGGSATFNYTVAVAEAGFVDSGWTLGGAITVTNPNKWQDITANVTDVVDNGGTCTVTGGQGAVIPAGKSVELAYSCAYATQPAYTGSNTATATWDKAAAFTPTGAAAAKVAFTMGLAGETNKTINVVDDKTNPAATPLPVLGQATYGVARSPFTYQLVKPAPVTAGTCVGYTNTAVIVQTKQSDVQVIQVCSGLLDKTSLPGEGSLVGPDQTISYSVKVTNTSAAPATRPVVDVLPTQLTAIPGTISDGGVLSTDGRSITWQVTLAAGESKTFTYQGVVDGAVADGADILNTATFAGLSDQTVHGVEVVVEAIEDEEVVAAEEEELADTGAGNVGNLVTAALLAMLAGGLMVTFGRRRREQ